MKVGYLGPEGTFCEEASLKYKGRIEGKSIELIPYDTTHDLLHAVNQGKLQEGVVPIENSIEGTVGVVLDVLVKEVDLKIKQEIILPITHYLLVRKNIKLSDITDVISHPQAIEQCREYLQKNLKKAKIHLAHSTANAAFQVANADKKDKFAAIGTKAAAKLYGLKVIASNINAKDNQTRFIVLANQDHKKTGKDKTSIVFSTIKDKPGSLHDILGEFAIRNINLTKIESRPSKKALGDYYFFIDMEGHRTDKAIADTFSEIKQKVSFKKVLGSYPRA